MSDKQFPYHSATDLVLPALQGFARSNTNVSLLEQDRVIFRSNASYESGPSKGAKKVTLISGGGSGHEPTHAGFVGSGLLDAAVCGSVFASPSTRQVLAGLSSVEPHSKGALVIVKNYTGDIINFGLAAERFKARNLKKGETEDDVAQLVVVQDDVAVGRKKGGLVGRRGLAGTIFVHKIAGAAAELSAHNDDITLATVADVARAVIGNTVTIGASLDHCNVPGREFQTNLAKNQMEIGMGIHNEPGVIKLDNIPTVEDLINEHLFPLLLDSEDKDRAYVPFSKEDEVILLVNNLGGISNLEISYIAQATVEALEKHKFAGFKPIRVVAGTYITAFNGPGFSLSLLNVSKANKQLSESKDNKAGLDILSLFDAPASAPGWSFVPFVSKTAKDVASSGSYNKEEEIEIPKEDSGSNISIDSKEFARIITAGLKNVVKEEPKLTLYDTVAGDGDCGETLVDGALAISKAVGIKPAEIGLTSNQQATAEGNISSSGPVDSIRLNDAVDSIADIADIVESSMGGTSGGLYAIYLSSLAQAIHSLADKKGSSISVELFAKAGPAALKNLKNYTRASQGDRTLMDALIPFVETLNSSIDKESPEKAFEAAVKAARDGAENTRKLEAKFGRASYVAQEELDQFKDEGGLPDPGAIGLACLLEGFLQGYKSA